MKVGTLVVSVVFVVCALACGGGIRRTEDPFAGGGSGSETGSEAARTGIDPGGFITLVVEGRPWRLEAVQGAKATPLFDKLDALSKGKDGPVTLSKNGQWMAIVSERFDCSDNPCLALLAGDVSKGARVEVGAQKKRIHPAGRAVASDDGKTIVYVGNDGPHKTDLYVIRESGGRWSEPTPLTANSPEPYNEFPSFNWSGNKVVFDCGPVPYGQEGTDTCEVRVDGTGLKKLIDSAADPRKTSPPGHQPAMHHPDYAPDGTIVVEGDWGSEQIWALKPGDALPTLIGEPYGNDNSPCVLPSGYIVSLWLGDPEGDGKHQLKVMRPDGTDPLLLTPPSRDVDDVGMSCSGPLRQ
jgi:hypothetical protein